MKSIISKNSIGSPVIVAVVTLTFALSSASLAQTTTFRFVDSRVPVGTLFEYRKSNLDGTNAAEILVYVRDASHVESFKLWHDPASRATLVTARMDWSRFSVSAFEAFDLACARQPQSRATLTAHSNEFRVSFMPEPVPLNHANWHSYDFDFTSLSLTMPMLRDPRGSFSFWRSDVLFEPTLKFAELGEVVMKYQATEKRNGRTTLRYSIGGPGLGNTSGTWWSDALTGTLVEFELPIADEPGYDNVRMSLQASKRLSADEWESHKQSAMCRSPAAAETAP